ncbi:MAG: hypothetical protein PHI97_10260 [Desulfobulbus sp.]|nr:hypothetical protein [Desulfobulbus sp.]
MDAVAPEKRYALSLSVVAAPFFEVGWTFYKSIMIYLPLRVALIV